MGECVRNWSDFYVECIFSVNLLVKINRLFSLLECCFLSHL